MAFKDDVMFYLGTMTNNTKEDPIEEAMIDILEGESVCPECGHDPCSCKKDKKKKSKKEEDETDENETEEDDDDEEEASVSTKTAGGDDDDDGYHASTDTEDDDDDGEEKDGEEDDTEDDDDEEKDNKKKKASAVTGTASGDDDGDRYHASADTEKASKKDEVLTANKLGIKVPSDGFTPEEIEILKQIAKSKKSSIVADDHTNGRNGSVETALKESISRYAFDNAYEDKSATKSANTIKEMIKSKKISKLLRENGNHEAANAFSLAEEMYLDKTPGALKAYKAAVKKYLF